MLLGAFVLAIVSQAATVDWKVTGTVSELSYSVYLMAGTTAITSWESLAVIEAAALDSGSIVKSGRTYVANGSATHANITKDGSFYYVVVSADKNTKVIDFKINFKLEEKNLKNTQNEKVRQKVLEEREYKKYYNI